MGPKSKLEWLIGAGGVTIAGGGADEAADEELDEFIATASLEVVPVMVPGDGAELAEDEPTGPVPASIFATTGAAEPVVAPVPVIAPGAVPG